MAPAKAGGLIKKRKVESWKEQILACSDCWKFEQEFAPSNSPPFFISSFQRLDMSRGKVNVNVEFNHNLDGRDFTSARYWPWLKTFENFSSPSYGKFQK